MAKSEFSPWECLTPAFAISAFEFGRVWAPALAMSAFEIVRVCGSVDCIWEWCREGSVTFQFFFAASVAKIDGFMVRAHS